jgi:hypothetical protein
MRHLRKYKTRKIRGGETTEKNVENVTSEEGNQNTVVVDTQPIIDDSINKPYVPEKSITKLDKGMITPEQKERIRKAVVIIIDKLKKCKIGDPVKFEKEYVEDDKLYEILEKLLPFVDEQDYKFKKGFFYGNKLIENSSEKKMLNNSQSTPVTPVKQPVIPKPTSLLGNFFGRGGKSIKNRRQRRNRSRRNK